MEGTLEFLKYEYPEQPRWRQNNDVPTVSEMVTDNRSYIQKYISFKDHAKQNPSQYSVLRSKIRIAKRDLLLKYLLNVQQEEDIGVQDEGMTRQIIDTESRENSPSLLESFPSLEDEISCIDAEEEGMRKSVAETKNLYNAYREIVSEIKNIREENGQEFNSYFGLLEKKMFAEELHKLLMDGVMGENSTLPGHYSTERRVTRHHGEGHEYPKFETELIAEQTVQYLIDRYNYMLDATKRADISYENRLKMSFKCASSFLFTFLQLHPFADGNGRLARLLASYSMLSFSPFMTPIYNVFSESSENDYINALVEARRNLKPYLPIKDSNSGFELVNDLLNQNTGDLCAMLIESNWTMWRQFLKKLRGEAGVLFDWESTPSTGPIQPATETIDQNQLSREWRSSVRSLTRSQRRVTRSMTRSMYMNTPLLGVRRVTRSMTRSMFMNTH